MKQVFLIKERKTNLSEDFVLPRHPEFEMLKKLTANSWEAKNLLTNEIVFITRTDKGEFYIFEVEGNKLSC